MLPSKQEVFTILRQFNPWWEDRRIPDLPSWKRHVFSEIIGWVTQPPVQRAVLLSGARQTGKTTLFLQTIQALLERRVPAGRILYLTLDHPLIKLSGLESTLAVWREFHPPEEGEEYLFLDEIQFSPGWQTWLKHQVDFNKSRRIAVTGSATPLVMDSPESGVGRWHTIRLSTLAFGEYLQIRKTVIPELANPVSFDELFGWAEQQFIDTGERAKALSPHFHQYLLRGGFPQTALIESVTTAQKLLREDILDKVLMRDMTTLFGIRRIAELEKTFLYLCLHDGGILDIPVLCRDLELKKPTVQKFLDLLEAAHLIIKLPPFGYGKEILRGRHKVYLADPAMAGSMLLKGQSLLEDTIRLGAAVETAFVKHVWTHYSRNGAAGFSYWRGKYDQEVDIVIDTGEKLIPYEVKYRQNVVGAGDIKGLLTLCRERQISQAYVITRELNDFGLLAFPSASGSSPVRILKIPAALACYWLSLPGLK